MSDDVIDLGARRAAERARAMADANQASCEHPGVRIEIDTRLVFCDSCCKKLDPFDLLVRFAALHGGLVSEGTSWE